jgi:hypothetical protein
LWLLGCTSDHNERADFSYFKVVTSGSADSITAFNKGLGTGSYVYYDPIKDSLIFQYQYASDPVQYKTFFSRLGRGAYVDTIANTIKALRKYKHGLLPFRVSEGSTYCGPVLYVEFKDHQGFHYYNFILTGDNDTLEQFGSFYENLPTLPLNKHQVSNNLIKRDSEMVAVVKNFGLYDKIEVPYIPLPCDSGIDMTKLYGTWRAVDEYYKRKNNYHVLTINKEGLSSMEEIREGKTIKCHSGKILVNERDKTITFLDNEKVHKFIIVKLSQNCLVYKNENGIYVERYDRTDYTPNGSFPKEGL